MPRAPSPSSDPTAASSSADVVLDGDLSTVVASCAQRVLAAILGGQLLPGSRLPAERELAVQWGVNRVTVRGALHRLSAAGLLAVRQGRGYTVQDFRRAGGPDLLPHLLALSRGGPDPQAQRLLLADLLRVRRHLAAAALEAVAERRPSPAPLAAAVDAFGAAIASSGAVAVEGVATADLAVLGALLSMTGSPTLQLCLNPIAAVLSASPELRAQMYRHPLENLAGWRALLAWTSAPSPDPGAIPAFLALLAARDQQTLAALS